MSGVTSYQYVPTATTSSTPYLKSPGGRASIAVFWPSLRERFGGQNTGEAATSLSASHKSQSGPVRVIRRFTPEPISPEAHLARLKRQYVRLQGRLADQEVWNERYPRKANPNQARNLAGQAATLAAQIRGASKEAIFHNPVGDRAKSHETQP